MSPSANPQHRNWAHRPIDARVMIADAIRYMSVDSCREPDSAGLRCTSRAANNTIREPENAHATAVSAGGGRCWVRTNVG